MSNELKQSLTSQKPADFRYQLVNEGASFIVCDKNNNCLVFLMEGELTISCNEFINKRIEPLELFLIPIAADTVLRAVTSCKLLLFNFESFFIYNGRDYMNQLLPLSENMSYKFTSLPIAEPIEKFVNHLAEYLRQRINSPVLHEIKHAELQILFQAVYSKEQLAGLFHPLIGKSMNFRIHLLRNYKKVYTVDELANSFGTENRTFSRQFKEEFGVSPYKWLLAQKAKHILFTLVETDMPLHTIREKYGFKFAGHFTRFCKEQFNNTPVRIRRSAKWSKNPVTGYVIEKY